MLGSAVMDFSVVSREAGNQQSELRILKETGDPEYISLACDPLAINFDVALFKPPFHSCASLNYDPAHNGPWFFVSERG